MDQFPKFLGFLISKYTHIQHVSHLSKTKNKILIPSEIKEEEKILYFFCLKYFLKYKLLSSYGQYKTYKRYFKIIINKHNDVEWQVIHIIFLRTVHGH